MKSLYLTRWYRAGLLSQTIVSTGPISSASLSGITNIAIDILAFRVFVIALCSTLLQTAENAWSDAEVLRLAAGVESNTIHPIGKAIVEAAQAVNFDYAKHIGYSHRLFLSGDTVVMVMR
ncbi:copper-transporting ATPase PAA1, chloroplastic [Senna tora]|uniref:Copper-transporting ATPase PAA1, chloroplastic n=1 Tax=Senna tora TaxID=362788 RepID=A0A834W5Y5_9FABA|nr:copper-transporting ATPase PAA1, chloroplastic [Senna tora]